MPEMNSFRSRPEAAPQFDDEYVGAAFSRDNSKA